MVRLSARLRPHIAPAAEAVVWHDLECSYRADLTVWSDLADDYGSDVLELGCGTGRVALFLCERGCAVTALDRDAVLLDALRERARRRELSIETMEADATAYHTDSVFDLVLAPMQLLQLLSGGAQRRVALQCARGVLRVGGVFAAALAQPPLEGGDQPPLPDICEHDGWVFSSLPVAVRSESAGFSIERLRQLVSPEGVMSQTQVSVALDDVSADDLERDAEALGFCARPRRQIPETDAHVASTVCVLEAV